MSNSITPATRNEAWGFWGTMDENARAAWPMAMAMAAISDATSEDLDNVRAFLDSRFADDVQNGLYEGKALADAINAATQRWMGWTIGRQTSKDCGIPRGMAYLTGFVIHCAIIEEQQAA